MNTTEPQEEGEPVPGADFDGLLRDLTLERFTLWRSPARSTGQAAPPGRLPAKTAAVSAADIPTVSGRSHDDRNSKPRRAR